MPLDPTQLRIVHYPDPALRQRARPIPQITQEVRDVARRMIELMDAADGIGLAAPQIALPWRLFVTRVPDIDPDDAAERSLSRADVPALVYINPVLSNPQGAPTPMSEGCLSLPDIRGDVLRPPQVSITALDIEGNEFTRTADGLIARCWQHEIDHLDGVLILDRFTQMSRFRNRAAIRALERGA